MTNEQKRFNFWGTIIFTIILVLAGLLGWASRAGAEPISGAAAIVEPEHTEAMKAVVHISNKNGGASGFFLNDGLIVTNWHVANAQKNQRVEDNAG